MREITDIIEDLRKGTIDCNDQALFLGSLIKALMANLNESILIRNKSVPHLIINTGDDQMWLASKDYNYSDPIDNEDYIYSAVPRCVLTPGSINILGEQLSNPYTRGLMQLELDDYLLDLNAEFRRIPLTLSMNLKYILSSFTDTLELVQQAISKLMFIRTFKFSYLGQTMYASYSMPTTFQDQHLTDLSGETADSKTRTIELDLELECNMPIYEPRTITLNKYIARTPNSLDVKGYYRQDSIEREATDVPGTRGPAGAGAF